MQSKNSVRWFCDLLVNRDQDCIISIDIYLSIAKYFSVIAIFNNIVNLASCQAQTLSNRELLTFDVNTSVLSKGQTNLPKTISVSASDSSIYNKNPENTELQNHIFAVGDRSIKVKKINVSGNTLFQDKIAELTQPFVGKSTNLGELYKLRSAISQL